MLSISGIKSAGGAANYYGKDDYYVTGEAGSRDRAMALARDLIAEVLALGGTMSGEHGIGIAKRPFIDMELSRRSLTLQRGIKAAFDPAGLLNPGKVLP